MLLVAGSFFHPSIFRMLLFGVLLCFSVCFLKALLYKRFF
ncbi:hypothetical protein HM1_1806 [Heliomicrobium modesticaldum Ice1]|uniref:Uncharacterized protein n=1 Tax=Heliobacterium modesticaldum (strain ATCC 51547 / Ice1) TaxID=498761 RepID=B0TEW9_HELMI|nr:hypothetical protein HM1_1806 [Heliomicrobium modesticaldum Ice1]